MGRRFGREPGGIQALLDLHDAHPHALERELIALGARWRDVGSEGFTWGDAWAIANAPAPGSALYVALSPESRGWSSDTYVMADLVDAITRVAYYAEGQATQRRPKRPKPYPRPGVKPTHTDTQRFGYKPMPVADMRRILGWDKPAEPSRPRPCCLLPAPCKHRA